jgi:spore maturation protein CgeB
MEMFHENEEACFFSSKSELLEKTQWLLDNPEIILRIAERGTKRVWTDRHHVNGRAEDFLELIEKIEKQKSDGRGER